MAVLYITAGAKSAERESCTGDACKIFIFLHDVSVVVSTQRDINNL